MTSTPRSWLAVALLAVLTVPPGLFAQEPETFSESLIVREREILVDLPEGIDGNRLGPEDFRVLVDGVPREVTRSERAGGDWTILVYVDQVLARPGTVFYSGLALANRARELTGAGTVEVVVAGSDPQVVLPATREAKTVERTLTDLSAAARVERDRLEGRQEESVPAVPEARRQLDKLLVFLASRRPTGPHAVFLVADGPNLTPEQTALLERRDETAAPPPTVFHRASRLLAAYGWVVLPMPLRKEGIGKVTGGQSGLERIRQSSAPSKGGSVPPIIPSKPPRETTLSWTGVIDLATDPRTAALRVLSRASVGTVIGFEEQIAPALAGLSRRWRLWIAEPDEPVDGRLHTVEVRHPDQIGVQLFFFPIAVNLLDDSKKQARPQKWIRSSTPEEVAEARIENLFAGRGATGGDLPFKAFVGRAPAGAELRIEVAPLQVPDSAPPGPLRITWGFSGNEGEAAVHHEIVPVEDLGKGVRRTFRIDPLSGTQRIAVVVEALGPEMWGGTVLEIEL